MVVLAISTCIVILIDNCTNGSCLHATLASDISMQDSVLDIIQMPSVRMHKISGHAKIQKHYSNYNYYTSLYIYRGKFNHCLVHFVVRDWWHFLHIFVELLHPFSVLGDVSGKQ